MGAEIRADLGAVKSPRWWRAFLPEIVCGTIAVVVSVRGLIKATPAFNNFDIFRHAFGHLVHGANLYALDAANHVDYFKYSPAFALFMAPFWWLPRALGLLIWNLANALAPCLATRALGLSSRAVLFVLLFTLPELTIAVQNAQSNGLVLGAMLGAFAALERKRPVLAGFLIAFGCVIKPFVIVMAVCGVFHPRRRRFGLALVGFLAALGISPVLVQGFWGLVECHGSWLARLASDRPNRFNISLMSFLQTHTGLVMPTWLYLPLGGLLLLVPLFRRAHWERARFRLCAAASVLMWVVLFNHKSESPTYVIAAYGVALWGVAAPRSWPRVMLLAGFFVLTELASTDLIPRPVRQTYLQPHQLKVLPLILIWLTLVFESMRRPVILGHWRAFRTSGQPRAARKPRVREKFARPV